VRDAIARCGPKEDLCLLKANLDFRFHRLAEVKRDLDLAPALRGRVEGRAILADLDFQEGRYSEAKAAYESLIQESGTWDNLARLAYFKGKTGDPEAADRLYAEAEDELTAKEMRSFAWLELQRGVLDLTHGRYEDAEIHYRRARRAFSGYWHIDEHMAELLAAQGQFDEAAALFTRVIARAPKPELLQTLGELYVFAGQPKLAEPWFDRALEGYLASAALGEVCYFHHLTDFYADVRPDGAEAVKWARKDIELRRNFATQAALAWALYRSGNISEAMDQIGQALASGVVDAHLFSQAAAIHEAAGNAAEAARYLRAARENNPRFENFHVHR
jgi:tetratricopeptide (TPR) repeat protein